MIRIFSSLVKQIQSSEPPMRTSLVPDLATARIRRSRAPLSERGLRGYDALLLIAPPKAQDTLAALPEARRILNLHHRSAAVPLTVRSTALANAAQTEVVLGYSRPAATHFERLALAGRLWRELADRQPARVALLVSAALEDQAEWYEALLAAGLAHNFALPDYRSKPPARWRLVQLQLYGAPALPLARIVATARGTNLARWLTALPPNKLDASGYRRVLAALARRHRLRLRWYSEAALRRLGAGAFLAVARANPARTAGIARVSWAGKRGEAAVALVGKGILFDTGGTNLKSHRSMLDMHTDMAGSAVALATVIALSELRSPQPAEAWLAITENNIGPNAYRPQEIVRALNGTTIQVIHTDAEGRMALADTLALAARARPALMIDYATLTGACVNALTERYSGAFSNRPALADALLAAGTASGERVWQFPLDADFDSDLTSKLADIMQCAVDGKGDHILAARFLNRFVPETVPWVHLDLSSATRNGGLAHVPTDVTGFGVRFTLQLLLDGRWRTALRRRKEAP